MKRLFPALLMLAASSAFSAGAPNLQRGQELAETICIACHAADGNSAISIYPRIAGQHAAYGEAQLKAIRDGVRVWGMASAMTPLVEGLTDEDARDVSAYYQKQVALSGEADPNLDVTMGKLIYRGGIPEQNVPACMSCHGPNGAGIPAASLAKDGVTAYPRVTGQHKDYMVTQMQAFRDGSRAHAMMAPIATRLTDAQIDAVTNYIQGLY